MSRDELVRLHKKLCVARELYNNLGMLNSVGLTPEERVDLDLRYTQAGIAYQRLQQQYDIALRQMVGAT